MLVTLHHWRSRNNPGMRAARRSYRDIEMDCVAALKL